MSIIKKQHIHGYRGKPAVTSRGWGTIQRWEVGGMNHWMFNRLRDILYNTGISQYFVITVNGRNL